MALSDTLLPEYDNEMKTTRRVLERVDESQLAWQPHEKSMTLGRLASHLAELPAMGGKILGADSWDIAAGDYKPHNLASRSEILEHFDKHAAATRAEIAGSDDAKLLEMWTFKRGEQTIFKAPKIGALRGMIMNHIIHHRGQLTVYLRLTGSAVPSVYGPSADESV